MEVASIADSILQVMRVDSYCKQYQYKVTLLVWALDIICDKDQI